MKKFTEYRQDFIESFTDSKIQNNKKNFDLYVNEWLNSISKKSISDLNESQFLEFKNLTEDWNNKKIKNFKIEEKQKLNENQISLIKNIFKILEFKQAKEKILNINNLNVESINETQNEISILTKKFQPLTFQKIGRDKDSVEQQTRLQFQEKLKDSYKEDDFLIIFNSMFESNNNLSDFYLEVDQMLS